MTVTEKYLVEDIMTTELYVLNPSDPVLKAQKMFTSNNIRHLPVVQDEKLVGILSKTDIMRLSFGELFETELETDQSMLQSLRTEHVMKSNPKSIGPTDTIIDVAKILRHEEYHALPVEQNGKLVGIITTTDVINYLIEINDKPERVCQ